MKWYWILLIVLGAVAIGLLIAKVVKNNKSKSVVAPVIKTTAPTTTVATTTPAGTVATTTNDVTGARITTIDTSKKS